MLYLLQDCLAVVDQGVMAFVEDLTPRWPIRSPEQSDCSLGPGYEVQRDRLLLEELQDIPEVDLVGSILQVGRQQVPVEVLNAGEIVTPQCLGDTLEDSPLLVGKVLEAGDDFWDQGIDFERRCRDALEVPR